jgi:hypothetical protein
MLATGRRSSHVTAWRGPCTAVTRFSATARPTTENLSARLFERTTSNQHVALPSNDLQEAIRRASLQAGC